MRRGWSLRRVCFTVAAVIMLVVLVQRDAGVGPILAAVLRVVGHLS